MQVISEKDLTPKQAHHFMKRVAKDSFIEENDQQKAKNIALVLSELSLHQDDIVDAPKIEEETKQEEIVEEKKEEIKNELLYSK